MTSKEQCGDDRFEIINETKEYIINATNIETSSEEMAVLDSICFRLWQLGLTKRNKDKLKEFEVKATPKKLKSKTDKDGRLLLVCPNCGDVYMKFWSDVETVSCRKHCDECGQALDFKE